jgi:O-acetylserine/cysteine efflux transporter
MAALLAVFLLKEKISPLQILGIFVAIAGVVVIKGMPEVNTLGFVLVTLSAAAFAVMQINMKTMGNIGIPTFAAYTSLFSLPFLVLFAYFFEGKVNWDKVEYGRLSFVLAFQVLVLGFAQAIWQKLTVAKGVNKIVPFNLLAPVFAIISGYLILGEYVTLHILVGAGIIIAGVALTTFFNPETKEGKLRKTVGSLVNNLKAIIKR